MNFLNNKGEVKIGKLTLTRRQIINICVIFVALIAIIVFATAINNNGSVKCDTCLGKGKVITTSHDCETCGGEGTLLALDGGVPVVATCPDCGGDGVRKVICEDCNGTGKVDGKECETCEGTKKVAYEVAEEVECPDCQDDYGIGTGILHADEECPNCNGDGKILTKTPVCKDCKGKGTVVDLETLTVVACPTCAGEGVINSETEVMSICLKCDGDGVIEHTEAVNNRYYGTIVSLLPPIIAIVLALITKEVYSSLFVGVLAGALFRGGFKFAASMDAMVGEGFIGVLSDGWNMGIIVFLVILGAMVALINAAGGAEAFGRWAKKHIKTKTGAALATFFLGVLIFIDDYFNCLTVGSVMRPVTDSKKISREKLAYLIDATAAPICMIAPISSWAAAVSSTAKQVGTNGISLFVNAIPYNFYSLLTIVMIIALVLLRIDFGPMKKFEKAAEMLDKIDEKEETTTKHSGSRVIDLVIPVALLIVSCVIGMIYSGGFFSGDNKGDLIASFGDSDASFGLTWGSIIALVVTIIYFIARRRLTFKQAMENVPKGFTAMVPAIMILTFAWSLNAMTSGLGAAGYVGGLMNGAAAGLMNMLPAIIFLVALGLAFATGTSWGTFGILIPIVVAVFGKTGGELLVIGISACLAGAVCGDHCSPISDTTIMASAGADCNHVNHVSTQLPYALTVAAVSFVSFILAGFIKMWYVVLPIAIALMIGVLFGIKYLQKYLDGKKGGTEAAPVAEAEGETAEEAAPVAEAEGAEEAAPVAEEVPAQEEK